MENFNNTFVIRSTSRRLSTLKNKRFYVKALDCIVQYLCFRSYIVLHYIIRGLCGRDTRS